MECSKEFRQQYQAYKARFEEHFSSPLQTKPEWVKLLSPVKVKELLGQREEILKSPVSGGQQVVATSV